MAGRASSELGTRYSVLNAFLLTRAAVTVHTMTSDRRSTGGILGQALSGRQAPLGRGRSAVHAWEWSDARDGGTSAREPEARVARTHARLGQPQLAANDVGALDESDALVVRDPPAQPLAPEAAVGGDDQALGRNVLEGLPDETGDVLGRLHHRVAVADHADAYLLVGAVLREERQVHPIGARALEGDDVGVELKQVREGALVARRLPVHALLVGIPPARVRPDLGVDPSQLPVERLGEELEVGVGAVGPRGAPVVRWLLDLDQRAAGGGQLAELGVHDVRQVVDERSIVAVVLVPQHAGESGGADGAELHGPVGEPLSDFPEGDVLERPARELLLHDGWLIRLLHLPQDPAGPQLVPLHPAPRGVLVAAETAEALDGVEEPGLAADGQVEAAVAVGHDVEPRGLLGIDDRSHGVLILLAEHRVAQRRLERAAGEVLVVPERARIRAGDGGGQLHVARDSQHALLRGWVRRGPSGGGR